MFRKKLQTLLGVICWKAVVLLVGFDWGFVSCVGFLTIAYREERETWAAELDGSGRDTWTLKETLTVTFIKRSYTGFRRREAPGKQV